ncbi:MAG: DUF3783 domain-containing protein [Lachnospiraceae bacterium]|nr:DUF3783 domain-containing protein [Lachnospiraceae bacterium]
MNESNGERVLLFGFEDGQQFKAIQMVLYMLQISGRCVTKEEYGVPLKMLAADEEIPNPGPGCMRDLGGQMIVFVGLGEEKLERLLALLRSNPSCGKIPYKAILTPINRDWNAYTLLAELKKEHAAMHAKAGD